MRMYYYMKTSHDQPVLKSSQNYGKEAITAGVKEDEKEWRFLASNGKIKIVKRQEDVDGLLLMEEISDPPEESEEGNYCIAVLDCGRLRILQGKYNSKSAAARFLPGLSMIYPYVCVLGEGVKPYSPFVSRADALNSNIYDEC
jgi:hypothetical protein